MVFEAVLIVFEAVLIQFLSGGFVQNGMREHSHAFSGPHRIADGLQSLVEVPWQEDLRIDTIEQLDMLTIGKSQCV